jgi:integrase
MPPLSDTKIRAAKPSPKAYKLFDGGGLYLLVDPSGGRWWRFKYRFERKERGISLGVYPQVSLREAREKRDAAKRLIASGRDPSAERQRERAAAEKAARDAKDAASNTFEGIAREWLAKRQEPTKEGRTPIAQVTAKKTVWMLETFTFPHIGAEPVSSIGVPELLRLLRKIEAKGARHTAHRTRGVVDRIFAYAIATGRADRNPAKELAGALLPEVATSRRAITDEARLGELLRAIEGYRGDSSTTAALRLLPHVFVRPGELRGAEWREFNLEDALWRIPGRRMKGRRDHLVPLSTQALAILKEHQKITGDGRLVFPSPIEPTKPLSNNTFNNALRKLKFGKDEVSSHGFRSTASTILNENSWSSDSIEIQLAHRDASRTRAVYNRAERLPDRRLMMQFVSDYYDALRLGQPKPKGAKVMLLQRKA